MHDAFMLVDVITGLEDKVASLTYFGDNVYVGTANGKIHSYRVVSPAGGKTDYTSARFATVDVGSKAAVTQLEAIPDLNLLIALSDGALSLWSLDNLTNRPRGVLDQKNVVSFALNVKGYRENYKLCVVSSKKRLRIYEWNSGSVGVAGGSATAGVAGARGQYTYVKELDVPAVPHTLVYCGTNICVGYQREYNIVCESRGVVTDVTGTMARDTRPLIKYVPPGKASGGGLGDRILCVTAEDVGVIVQASGPEVSLGQPSPEPAPHFGHHPHLLAYCFPYMISTSEGSHSKVEVHGVRSGRCDIVQRIDAPGSVIAMVDGRVGHLSRTERDFADVERGRNPVYIAFSSGGVKRLHPAPVDYQVRDMLRQYQIPAAQELLQSTAPTPAVLAEKMNRLNIDAGRVLFFALQYEPAFAHLAASSIDPREVIALFPDAHVSAAAVGAARAEAVAASLQEAELSRLRQGAPAGSTVGASGGTPLAMLVRAYKGYGSRYFSPSLTHAIASGLKTPGDAASELADGAGAAGGEALVDSVAGGNALKWASGGVASHHGGGAGGLRGAAGGDGDLEALLAEPASSGGGSSSALEAGFGTGVADINSLLHAGVASFEHAKAVLSGREGHDHAHGEEGGSTSRRRHSLASEAMVVPERHRAVLQGFLRFLRQRRVHVRRHLFRLMSGAAAAGASGSASPDGGAAGSAAGPAFVVVNTLAYARGKRSLPLDTAYSLEGMSLLDTQALAVAVDTALAKTLAHLGQWGALDRLLSHPSALDLPDMAAFLSHFGKYHSLALLHRGRGRSADALLLWRRLGMGELKEAPLEEAASGAGHGSTVDDDDDDDDGANEEGGCYDSLSEEEDGASGSRQGGGGAGGARSGGRKRRTSWQFLLDLGAGRKAPLRPPGYLSGLFATDAEYVADPVSAPSSAEASCTPGLRETVVHLQSETNEECIFEFSRWVLLKDPGLGLTIFTDRRHPAAAAAATDADAPPSGLDASIPPGFVPPRALGLPFSLAEPQPGRALAPYFGSGGGGSDAGAGPDPHLPHSRVVEFLRSESFVREGKRSLQAALVHRYLEHLVFRVGLQDDVFHTELGTEYAAAVLQLRGNRDVVTAAVVPAMPGAGRPGDALAPVHALTGTHADRPAPGSEGGMLGQLRSKLLVLLQESAAYDAPALMAALKDTTLYEERVVLHARQGQHEQALRLLVFGLADHKRAVRYCELIAKGTPKPAFGPQLLNAGGGAGGGAAAASGGDPFITLLSIYINADKEGRAAAAAAAASPGAASPAAASPGAAAPPPTAAAEPALYLTLALDALAAHSGHIDPLAAARVFPADLPLASLLPYLSRIFPASVHATRQAAATKSLYNFACLTAHSDLVTRQAAAPLLLQRTTSCLVCERRFTEEGVFALLPTGRPVHLHCLPEISHTYLPSTPALDAATAKYGALYLGAARPEEGGGAAGHAAAQQASGAAAAAGGAGSALSRGFGGRGAEGAGGSASAGAAVAAASWRARMWLGHIALFDVSTPPYVGSYLAARAGKPLAAKGGSAALAGQAAAGGAGPRSDKAAAAQKLLAPGPLAPAVLDNRSVLRTMKIEPVGGASRVGGFLRGIGGAAAAVAGTVANVASSVVPGQ